MKRQKSGVRGSITVEASIIVPFTLLCIAAFMYMGLVAYQRAQVQSAADRAVEAGSAAWSRTQADIGTGRIKPADFEETGLYWRLVDADREEKLGRIARFAEDSLKKGRLLKPVSSRVSADVKDFIIYKKLVLVVENRYELPFGNLVRIFGATGFFSISVEADAVIDDPAEMRRNVDFAADIEKELEEKYPGLRDIREKAGNILSDVKGKMDEFFK